MAYSHLVSTKKHDLLLVMVVGATVWVLTCPLSFVIVSTDTTFPDLLVSVSYLMVEVNPCEFLVTSVTMVLPLLSVCYLWVMMLWPPLLVVE